MILWWWQNPVDIFRFFGDLVCWNLDNDFSVEVSKGIIVDNKIISIAASQCL